MTPQLRLTRATARALAVCLTAALAPTTIGCGAKTLDTSTDTGNPPVVDIGKLSSEVDGGTVIVTGKKGAATPGGSLVTVTNQRTGEQVSVKAKADGSFTLTIAGAPGDTLEVAIAGGKRTELLHVADTDAGIAPVDAGDTSDDDSSVPPATTDGTAQKPTAPSPVTSTAPSQTTPVNPTATSEATVPVTSSTPPSLRIPEKHRAARETCDEMREPVRPSPGGQASPPPDGGGILTCADGTSGTCCYDEDCGEGSRGRCVEIYRRGNSCSYDVCTEDSDCTTGGPCVCGDNAGDAGALTNDTLGDTCLGGNCQIDSDCSGGELCSPSFGSCGSYFGVEAYYCHTPEDECTNDDECVDDTQPGAGFCMHSSDVNHWVCSYALCVG